MDGDFETLSEMTLIKQWTDEFGLVRGRLFMYFSCLVSISMVERDHQ